MVIVDFAIMKFFMFINFRDQFWGIFVISFQEKIIHFRIVYYGELNGFRIFIPSEI